MKKLQALRRIAADHLEISSRESGPNEVKRSLITPLEKYIIALSSDTSTRRKLPDMAREAQRVNLNHDDRRKKADIIAQEFGKVGILYRRYRKEK